MGGIMKVMSKIGISTLRSYKGGQVFEAVGLSDDVVDRCFAGTASRISGAGFEALHQDALRRHATAYPQETLEERLEAPSPALRSVGTFHYKPSGEAHYNDPHGISMLQLAARNDSTEAYERYARHVNGLNRSVTLRGLLKFNDPAGGPVPIDEVEPVQAIVKRFCTGAMSLGSISTEAHETLALAMNEVGDQADRLGAIRCYKQLFDQCRSIANKNRSG